MAIDNVKKVGGSLNISETSAFGSSPAPKTDINMTPNGSIFLMGDNTTSKKNDNTNTAKTADLTQQGDTATKDAESTGGSAKGQTGVCKQVSATGQKLQTENTTMAQSFVKAAKAAFNTIMKNQQNTEKLTVENEKNNAEIASLTAEKAALSADDGTGSGKDSAFSLSIPTETPKAAENKDGSKSTTKTATEEAAPDETATASEENATKSAAIDTKIGTLTAGVKTNTTTIKTNTKSTNTSRGTMTNLFTQASKKAATSTATTEAGAAKANTAQTVGTVTTVTGGATTAVGAVMTCFTPTAVAGVATMKVGAGVTGVGGATTGAAALAAKDNAGANASIGQVTASAGTINELNKQTAPKDAPKDPKTT